MKVLGVSTLVFEAILFALAIPVAASLHPPYGGWVATLLLVLSILAAYQLRTSGGTALGWITQGASLVASIAIPVTIPLAVIFTALWWAALHFGRKADAGSDRQP